MFKIILLQHLGCPYTELNTTIGMYTITYADNHVEVIISDRVFLTICGSCCKICNN